MAEQKTENQNDLRKLQLVELDASRRSQRKNFRNTFITAALRKQKVIIIMYRESQTAVSR